jgi:hypothetical protein
MARVKGVGADCATFLACVYEEAEVVPHIDIDVYSPQWHLHRSEEMYLKEIEKYCAPVDFPLDGDIIMVKVARCYAHGAIVTKFPQAVHALVERGVILCDLSNDAGFVGRARKYYSPWKRSAP